jgi:hypothetical protein
MEYNFNKFDITGQLKKELEDFFDNKITIGGAKKDKNKGYRYNQAETLNLIEYIGASKFEKGEVDSEGQQKFYLNQSVFRADVASKMIDIDVKDHRFIPADGHSEVPTILLQRKFKNWAKDVGYGIELNDMVEKFPFYGSLVIKGRGKEFDIVDINKLRNQQDAKSLNEASYVIIEHTMKMWEAQDMPDWDLSGLEYEWDDDITVYERYGRVPKQFFEEGADEKESVDTLSFICLDKKGKKEYSQLLFIEEIKNRPFKECHWKRRAGRWLGVGEIENNFENQKARNAVFNLRMRSVVWSAKSIFQSTDESVAKNLVAEVRDGDVMTITGNGIQPVNTQTKALADYNAADQAIEQNSDQKSFTFEVATGEQLQSGTPFRLGVLMSNSVNNHFGLKREKLSLMLKELLYDFILPKFEKEISKDDIEYIASGSDGYEDLIDVYVNAKLDAFIWDKIVKEGRVPSVEEQEGYKNAIRTLRGISFEIFKDSFKDAKYKIDIVITGESVNLESKIETMTNLYNALAQRGDPRAEKILAKIITLTGERMPSLEQAPQVQPNQQLAGAIDMATQNTQNANE